MTDEHDENGELVKDDVLYMRTQEHNFNVPRRDVLLIGIGSIGYTALLGNTVRRIFSDEPVTYPIDHERHVSMILEKAVLHNTVSLQQRPLRILEIGIGNQCRSIIRGLYDSAFSKYLQLTIESESRSSFLGRKAESISIATTNPYSTLNSPKAWIELTGVDLEMDPSSKTMNAVQERLSREASLRVDFKYVQGDLMSGSLPFPDGYFDIVTCVLVLCSVTDPSVALSEIKRLLRPNGGTFAYVEHVAVDLNNSNEKHRQFLEWQQRVLDPLQQAVAHNCHLHRSTETAIRACFQITQNGSPSDKAEIVTQERFFVDGMWPVSCQCCGVIRRNESL